YSKGTDAQKKEFAELQVSDPYEAVASYVEPAIRRAAYARRFGDDGAKLERVLGRMKTQGATDAQVREARNVVAATLGSYGHEYSPTIAMLSESLAKKVAGRDSQATIQGLQAYQNVRLLPLATLSSIIDPLGIAVRTGGDMKTAWEGMKLGLRTLFDGSTKADMLDALSMLGATDEMSTLAAGFGGGTTPLTRKVNDFVFRLNGLAGWTRATRFMALHAGHQFLIKHATKPNKHSQRYLDELGIKAGDIETETLYLPNGRSREAVKLFTGNKARDTRVQHALSQFIDEAILRPGSTQRPLWHSDPYMGLVSQYKGFAYAIWDQVGGRIAREWSKGNVAILMPALLYAPITIMVELMRELIQHGPEGDARRKDWGPDDYLLMGVDRSNVFFSPRDRAIAQSINDVKNNRVFGSSQIGPTISQARDIYSAASAQRSAGKTFEDALPASPLWKRWNDDGIADNVPAVAAANLVKENV
ncbi:MAG: hypothetical protein KC492_18765, partial [Myxococcales bacterium]|nr:hypothetical protein [Myxococcales bacterium]